MLLGGKNTTLYRPEWLATRRRDGQITRCDDDYGRFGRRRSALWLH